MGFLNGLSAAGAAISQYAGAVGLQQQKADLQNQSLMLADQLQGARESAGRQEAGQIAAAAADKAQNFAAGQSALQRQSSESIAAGNNQTSLAVANVSANSAMAVERAREAADTPEMKLLRAIGGLPPSGATAPSGGQPAPSGTTPALTSDGLVSDDTTSTQPSAATGTTTPTQATPGGSADPRQNSPLMNKYLGLPQPGTPAALQMGVARDVANDPLFKDLSPGQQALETQKRIAVSEGKMTDPTLRAAMAQGIANYQIAPLSGMAARSPEASDVMAQVLKINPDYQAGRFPEVSKALGAFSSGKQGDIIRSLNVGVQHLSALDDAAQALGNGNVNMLNSLRNRFQTEFGVSAPPTFEALKQIVGTEVEKAVAGGIGAVSDRDRIMAALSASNSPAQLKAVTDGFRHLMVGQLNGLKTQYEDATGIKAGAFAFENKLDPETKAALSSRRGGDSNPASSSPAPSAPSKLGASTVTDTISAAQAAIAAGAPRSAVIARLRANGIDPGGLDTSSPTDMMPTAGQD